MLSNYRAGDKVRVLAIVRVQKIGQSSTGNPFARGSLQDQSGIMNYITFDSAAVELLREVSSPAVLAVYGSVSPDKYAGDGALQIMVEGFSFPAETDDLSQLLPVTPKNVEIYKGKLKTLIDGVENVFLRSLVNNIFSAHIYEKFIKSPAAMRHHHAYLGGLLEHSVDVAILANEIGKTMEGIELDLVVCGGLLHDIGKIVELSNDLGFEYTDDGRLIGHLTLGVLLVEREIQKISEFPPVLARELLHIIISHHGEVEKGSPVPCVTRESMIVHYADEINAVMSQFVAEDNGSKGNWQYSKMLNRAIRVQSS